jgi:hypothetical protein
MSFETPPVYAGPGLLRSGTILSVNPNLKVKDLTVRNKITVPQPVDVSDAASKQYVDNTISPHGIAAGDGIVLKTVSDSPMTFVSLSKNVTFDTIRLSGSLQDSSSVSTKGYVDSAVSNLATKDALSSATDNMAKLSDVQNAVKPLVTASYIENIFDRFVSRDDLGSSLSDYATRRHVSDAIRDFSTTYYVDDMVKNVGANLRRSLESALQPLATIEYVNRTTTNFVTEETLNVARNDLTSSILSQVKTTVQDGTKGFATASDIAAATAKLATVDYVDNRIGNAATRLFVNELITPLAEESYVDNQIADLASTSYVDDSVERMADIINAYIDKTFTTTIKHSVQYVTPRNGDTIVCDGSSYVLLNPGGTLFNLSIVFPTDVEDGQLLNIATSHEVSELSLENLVSASTLQTPLSLKPGQGLKFLFSSEAVMWFVVT